MDKNASLLFHNIDFDKFGILSDNEVEHLPILIKEYLNFSGAIGKKKPLTLRLKQTGLFNVNGKKWSKISARQYFNTATASFIWNARVGPIYVTDQFINNKGRLKVKLFNIFKLSEVTGKEMDQGEALRLLTEMIWFPSAFISDYVSWESINNHTLKATITYGSKNANAYFHFKSNGEIEKITAKRYREIAGSFEMNDWEITIIEYKIFSGIKIPYKCHVGWKLPNKDLLYYKFEITDIEYNIAEVY